MKDVKLNHHLMPEVASAIMKTKEWKELEATSATLEAALQAYDDATDENTAFYKAACEQQATAPEMEHLTKARAEAVEVRDFIGALGRMRLNTEALALVGHNVEPLLAALTVAEYEAHKRAASMALAIEGVQVELNKRFPLEPVGMREAIEEKLKHMRAAGIARDAALQRLWKFVHYDPEE